jgi:ribosomal protein RSM22 (predicted rRNA methylase)
VPPDRPTGVDFGPLSVSWHKALPETTPVGETLAVSAFALSGMPTPLQRKQLVKEMWASGAGTIVLIDHSSRAGFEAVAEARALLLSLGRKEREAAAVVTAIDGAEATAVVDDVEVSNVDTTLGAAEPTSPPTDRPLGSYALAPCPHDGVCPLFQPEGRAHKLACGFSQRLQRPAFVRKTKGAGAGHEDVGYSYVVVRRGARPAPSPDAPKLGRIGQVGRRQIAALEDKIRAATPPREMEVAGDPAAQEQPATTPHETALESAPSPIDEAGPSSSALEAALRLEAHAWPRLVFPPLKRSGHVILDVCAPSGRIERATIPRSQGAQPYHDARKARWGDAFPHAPKNAPVPRVVPADGRGPTHGTDIGKRGVDLEADERKAREKEKRRRKEADKARKNEVRRDVLKSKWDAEE